MSVQEDELNTRAGEAARAAVPLVSSRAFCLPKAGCTPEQYEDAWMVGAEQGRFAVADGASESVFAGQWAGLLARRFVEAPPAADADAWREWIRPAQVAWREAAQGPDIPWYVAAKVREG